MPDLNLKDLTKVGLNFALTKKEAKETFMLKKPFYLPKIKS
jgi:hypothetical protein